MKATKQLIAEHQAVRLVLQIFQVISDHIQEGRAINYTHVNRLLDFLKVFIDKCHHTKEEQILFPILLKKNNDLAGGPISVMLNEHDQGRKIIKQLLQDMESYKKDPENTGPRVIKDLDSYTSLLSQHILKENNILFPMADSILSEIEQNNLFDAFEELEINEIGPGTHEGFHNMLEEYATVYLN